MPTWSEPYFDEGAGNIIMVTYSMPFYRNIDGKRVFTGVVTADISLEWLQKIISSIKIGQTGYGFLLSKNGTFVTHPNPDFVMNETIFSVAEALEDNDVRELGRKMVSGNSGFSPFTSTVSGKKCWMVYMPLSSNGWSLAVLFPQDELMADISRLSHTVLLISILGFFIILIVTIWIARTITSPLRALSRATEEIAAGHLDIEIPFIKSRDEVGRLADSFTYMKTSLKKYILELTEATAARERIVVSFR
jgi:sigma-B regulation protein RsbU (phosphoserine phosphatase)